MKVNKKVNFEELARSTDEFNGAQLKVCPCFFILPHFDPALTFT